jgi:phage FluMu protein gp41
MKQVHTTKGLIDIDLLTVKDIVENHDNARVVATEWHLGEELVRRDVAVSILRGQDVVGEQAKI